MWQIIKFIKQHWFKLSVLISIVIVIIVFIGAFYWFELRPVKIKHDCSWVEKYSNPVPEITKQQYDKCVVDQQQKSNERKKDYADCKARTPSSFFCDLFLDPGSCANPRPAEPIKSWWEPASKAQYDFCIHEKGL